MAQPQDLADIRLKPIYLPPTQQQQQSYLQSHGESWNESLTTYIHYTVHVYSKCTTV